MNLFIKPHTMFIGFASIMAIVLLVGKGDMDIASKEQAALLEQMLFSVVGDS